MSKFSEALRKIEESRSQKKFYSFEDNLRKSSRRDKIRTFVGYAVLLLGILLAVFSFVYDFGFNKVIRPPQRRETEQIVKIETVAVKPSAPVGPSENTSIPEANVTEQVSEEKVTASAPAPVPAEKVEENATAPGQKETYYTIQLVTYQKREPAEHEVGVLAGKGLRAFILPDKKYYAVCVERFDTKSVAAKKIAELKKTLKANTYKDAFIRFVK